MFEGATVQRMYSLIARKNEKSPAFEIDNLSIKNLQLQHGKHINKMCARS